MSETATSDSQIVDILRRRESATVAQLSDDMGVTATAVRQRLNRLLAGGLIERQTEKRGRGRPSHQYRLTSAGLRAAGSNFGDLAMALWQEMRAIPDREVRNGLLKRLSRRLADQYRPSIRGDSLSQRMQNLADVFSDREIPFVVEEVDDKPVLKVLACPYPELAEKDRSVCSMERMMISDLLGEATRLSQCRLDGHDCCSFQPSDAAENVANRC